MRRAASCLLWLCVLGLPACRRDMHDQPKYRALEGSELFADGRASRPVVEGTVARGQLDTSSPRATGKAADGTFVATMPVPVTAALVARGRERYDAFCSPCHDRTGSGRGMVVRRGYKPPPAFHEARLREAADGYVFDAITNGFGVMPSYAVQVPVDDRWAIVAYVRALQRAQAATLADVPAADRARLEAEGGAP